MSDTEELSKEERLEAARKKYEELKKKKNKKKGKKTKKAKEDEVEDEKEAEEVEDEKDVDVENGDEKDEEKDEEKEEKEEEKVVEEKADVKVEEKEEKEADKPKEVEPVPQSVSESGANTPASIVTPSEVQLLKDTIAQQDKTIKKLRDDNTDLKLEKMDLKDKINELQGLVERLKAGGAEAPSKKVGPAKPIITKNIFASESKQDLSNLENISDFRERLLVWKNWQVDMTAWNSTYSSEKIAL